MNKSTSTKGSVLFLVGVVLIIFVALLLFSLHKSPDKTNSIHEAPQKQAPNVHPIGPSPKNATTVSPHVFRGEKRTQAVSVDSSISPSSLPTSPPNVVRIQAPPFSPKEIENEKDAVHQAQLKKMHKLATTRFRVSMLRHREQLLRTSLEKAKTDGSWTKEKLKQAEQDLKDLQVGINAAEKELDRLAKDI